MLERSAVIVGGGIGGLTAALCLAKQNWSVLLLEQAASFGEAGAGIQVSPNCARVLIDLGLAAALDKSGFRPEGIEMRDAFSGSVLVKSTFGERYPWPYYHLHRADLLELLVDAAMAEDRITLQTGVRVQDVEFRADGVSITLGDASVTADLLIGADGIHSTVRERMFGVSPALFTGNVAWRGLVPADALPPGLVRPVATAWWGPGKHMVHYYVRQGDLVNCVCVVEKSGWEIESWVEPGDVDELRNEYAGWHGDVLRLLEVVQPDQLFKWALFDRAPMQHWSEGHATLLGDACHATLPFLAQGAAMAIEDAAVLAKCLAMTPHIPTALRHYESVRKPRTSWVQKASRRNARVYHMRGLGARLRNAAAGFVGERVTNRLYHYDALAEP